MGETNLFVGNLPPDATDEDLWALFGRFGTVLRVRAAVGRGFGFVEMADDAQTAARVLNGAPLRGYVLTVRAATAPP
jgi:RNA recognition motif-containing protein